MELCVFGAGSLGSLVGGVLASEHDVTLVGRRPHVTAIDEDGLRLTGEYDQTVFPETATEPPAEAELAIVTVKSFDTREAARALERVSLDGSLSLQNGMGNEGTLATHLDCPVLAGTCTYGARLVEPGVVECTGRGDIALGPRDGGSASLGDRTGEAFAAAGLDVTLATDMPRRLWEKLAINAGINAATALARVPNGALVDGPATATVRRAARETARAASANGVALDPESAAESTCSVAESTGPNTSSMHQDVRAGNRTEIDAINGYVVANADEPVPVNETLTGLVRAWERERGLRPDGR
jgi:2-dehydropantoate 2-reductase